MKRLIAAALLTTAMIASAGDDAPKKRLFILSGQSNMAGLDPKVSFTPAVEAEFGSNNVIVVKDAMGGQPIRRWYKQWKPPHGRKVNDKFQPGDLYDRLMTRVRAAVRDQQVQSVVFVWMQGESDAKNGMAAVYEDSLKGLIKQLRGDLGRQDVCFVIGRLSDNGNGKFDGGWDKVRAAEVKVAGEDPLGAWVDTDALNGPKDDLHYTRDGYRKLGELFAQKAIELVRKQQK